MNGAGAHLPLLAAPGGRVHPDTEIGFSPRIAYSCDDTVVVQSLVGAGM